MSTRITLTAADGHQLAAWRSEPDGTPRGGVVGLHAVFGLTSHMGDYCDRWAHEGYAAVTPALFDRVGPDRVNPYSEDGVEAGRKLYGAIGEAQILADIQAAADALRPAGKVAISGFCTGGTWAWIAGARLAFDAQVNFYGSHVPQHMELVPRCPTIMHYGDNDRVVPIDRVDAIRAAHPEVTVFVYPGGKHAFFNPDQLTSHYAEAAALAWRRSVDFLNELFAKGNPPC